MSNLTSAGGGGTDPDPKDKAISVLAALVLGLIGAWILFMIALPFLLHALGVRSAS